MTTTISMNITRSMMKTRSMARASKSMTRSTVKTNLMTITLAGFLMRMRAKPSLPRRNARTTL